MEFAKAFFVPDCRRRSKRCFLLVALAANVFSRNGISVALESAKLQFYREIKSMHIRARARRQKRIYLELDNLRELKIKFWFLGDFEAVSFWFMERLRHSPLSGCCQTAKPRKIFHSSYRRESDFSPTIEISKLPEGIWTWNCSIVLKHVCLARYLSVRSRNVLTCDALKWQNMNFWGIFQTISNRISENFHSRPN